MSGARYTRRMVESWQHSQDCLERAPKDRCICGLAALRAEVEHLGWWRTTFTLRAGEVAK